MNTGSIMARNTNSNNDGVTQLEFHQAMSDFKTMFPDMDEEVIEFVLRSNNGAVDATIDQLLLMASDLEKERSKPSGTVASHSMPTRNTESSATTNVASVDDLFFDIESSSSSLPSYSAASATGATGHARSTADDDQMRPSHNQLINLSDEPDNLSFLDPPSYLSASNSNAISSNFAGSRSNFDPSSFSQASKVRDCNLLDSNSTPSITATKSTALDRRFSKTIPIQDTTGILSQKFSNTSLRARFRWVPPILGKLPESFLRIQQSSNLQSRSQVSSQQYDASSQLRSREMTASTSPSSTNFISSAMLAKKMQENERRRQQAIFDEDEEVARYLEDERFAILLQNAEFVHELRHNQEFMSQLEMDNKRGGNVPFNTLSSASTANSSTGPSSIAISDAAFREALKNMGKKSKKKFAQLAGVFKKKKGNLFNDGNFAHGFTGIAEVTSSPHRQSRDFLLDDSYREFENEYSSDSERDRNSPYWDRDANRPPHTAANPSSRLYTSSTLHPSQQNYRH